MIALIALKRIDELATVEESHRVVVKRLWQHGKSNSHSTARCRPKDADVGDSAGTSDPSVRAILYASDGAPTLLGPFFTPDASYHACYEATTARQERLYPLLVHRVAKGHQAKRV